MSCIGDTPQKMNGEVVPTENDATAQYKKVRKTIDELFVNVV